MPARQEEHRPPAQDAKLNFPSLTEVKEQTGVSVQADRLKRRIESTLTVTGRARPPGAGARPAHQAEGHPQAAGGQVPDAARGRPRQLPAQLYKNSSCRRATPWPSAPSGSSTPAGLYHIQNKGVNVPWSVPKAPGRAASPARWCRAASPENPLKARWMGIYRRRRHPRHRRRRLAGQRRLARLRADGDPRRDRAVSTGAGPDADLHRLSGARRRSPRPGPPPIPALQVGLGGPCGECTGCR